ncbi:RHS repeat protein [Streptomyces sp. ISL-43]|uniref:DUF6531 domain-containing protein n=1 Tax=Streptomyces sp. ISL-43 TaxID=2819183 RepID=UPI001BE7713F|nr:DUF6531 domain-containing protein [Streptomyces sp. ISL-43]MBT2450453.1 RHS repeat protein [Streptomyces sp. ISL-43]
MGDPVNTSTGALSETSLDASVAAPGIPISLGRTYNSANATSGSLGKGWSFPYDTRLSVSGATVTYVSDTGVQAKYVEESPGIYKGGSVGVASVLSGSVTAGFKLTTPAGKDLRFDGSGRLVAWTDSAGRGLSFSYNNAGLASATDANGRIAKFTLDGTTRLLTGVELPDGRTLTYRYTAGQLASVKGVDGGTVNYNYELQGWLAGVTDPAGNKVMQTTYDNSGRVTKQIDAGGKETDFTRAVHENSFKDSNGGIWTDIYNGSVLSTRIDPFGNVTSLVYDDALRLISAVDARGNRTKMSYDARGNLLSRAESALTQTWTYTASDKIASYTDGRGAKTTYTYDGKQQLTEENGPSGKRTYTYDALGQVKTTTSPGGKASAFAYDNKSNLTSETSPSGAKTTYTYDAAGRLLTSTEPLGNVAGADPAKYTTTNAYNAAGRLEKTTDAAGRVTSFEYDANGNQIKATDSAGRITTTTYDKFNRPVTVTAPGGSTTTTAYDAVGNVTSTVDAVGGKSTYKYDKANRLVATTTPRGNVSGADPAKYTTTYGYDANGNQTQSVDPKGALTTTEFDGSNRPVSMTDPLGRVTKKKYDSDGNAVEVTDALGKVTTLTYTASGQLSTAKNPLGKTATYTYDADGNRASATSPLGHKISWTYDANGRVATQTAPQGNVTGADPAKHTTTYTYDAAGNPTKVTNPLGGTQTFTYDTLGQRTAATDENGRTTQTAYDTLGRIQTVTAADGGQTAYTYDAAGNIKTRVDANQRTTTYGYNAAQQLTSVTDPLNRTVRYGYDADGNRKTVTNARGTVTTTVFDVVGRPTAVDYADTTPDVTTAYDAVGNRKTVTDATGTRTFTYDARNRLKTASVPGQTNGFSYTYNDAGQLTTRTLPHGRATTYTYDDDGNRRTATTDSATITYSYDPAGRLTTTQLPASNGYTETRTFDTAGRMTGIASAKAGTTLTSRQATLDAAGQPKRIDAVNLSLGNQTMAESRYHTYDNAGRLLTDCTSTTKSDTCPAGSPTTTYTYDKAGNRTTTLEADGKTTAYSYDAADQLTQTVQGTTTVAYTYDADGNQVTAGANAYRFDAQNRLTAMTQGTKTWATFAYDADGNRAKRDTTTRAWDINNSLPLLAAEYSSTGAMNADYTYNPLGEIEYGHAQKYPAPAPVYYHRDLVGSITDLTNPNGTTATEYDYTDTFGTGGPKTGDAEAPSNNFGYTGQYQELIGGEEGAPREALGYNLRARSYDPTTGRFTTRDPYTTGQESPAESPYAYVGNAPTSRFDPAGTCWWIPGSGKQSCWTTEIPGTSSIPLSTSMNWIVNSTIDSCTSGADYAKANGRTGWTGCIDEFTGVGSTRRGIDSFQQGDAVNGTAQCLGGIGQFGLLVLPGPKMGSGTVRVGAAGGVAGDSALTIPAPRAPLALPPAGPALPGVTKLYGPFHRKGSPTQTMKDTQKVLNSGELWGQTPRNATQPAAQAHNGPLPHDAVPGGFEFYTSVKPTGISYMTKYVSWEVGKSPGVREFQIGIVDWAAIPVFVTQWR